jgi:hypothetical protein
MNKQYVIEYQTEVGIMKFEYNYKEIDGNQSFNDLCIKVDGRAIDYPKAWAKQTTSTILRKVCDMLKGRQR